MSPSLQKVDLTIVDSSNTKVGSVETYRYTQGASIIYLYPRMGLYGLTLTETGKGHLNGYLNEASNALGFSRENLRIQVEKGEEIVWEKER